MLSNAVHLPVVDKTGLKGTYNIELDYSSDPEAESSLPSIFTALQEQLGLKLEPQRVPVDILIVDQVDKVPTEN